VPARAELPQYVMRDLGTFGFRSAAAHDVNNTGQIVGQVYLEDLSTHAFYYDGTFHDLGQGTANALNESGAIAGTTWYPEQATSWRPDVQYLGSGRARGINNAGVVAGQRQPDYRAYLWNPDGGGTDLGTLGGSSNAYAVNDNGVAVGAADLPGFPRRTRAFLWDGGTLHNLGSLGGDSWANDINNSGTIVGGSYTALDPILETRELHAVYWDQDLVMHDLGSGVITGINSLGLMVGQVNDLPVLWQDGVMMHLPTGGLARAAATGISDTGYIVGAAGSHALVWEPVPEPASFVGLVAGAGWFAAGVHLRNRRRQG